MTALRRVEYAHERKMRVRNTVRYRAAHWPIWIFVFFLAPGPLVFDIFAGRGNRWNVLWLILVMIGTGIAALRGRLPGAEPGPYILRFTEDRPNPLYRRVCYTFGWNAAINFALMNLLGLVIAVTTGRWYMQQIYARVYAPVLAMIVLLGIAGALPTGASFDEGRGLGTAIFLWNCVGSHAGPDGAADSVENAATLACRRRDETGRLLRDSAGRGRCGCCGTTAAHPSDIARRDGHCRLKEGG